MEKILVILSKYHLNLYEKGFLNYIDNRDVSIKFFLLYNNEEENFFNKKAYKYNLFGKQAAVLKKQIQKFKEAIKGIDKCLFINLPEESKVLLNQDLSWPKKRIMFVDTMKDVKNYDKYSDFDKIFSLEYGDIEYGEKIGVEVNYVPVCTSYHLFPTKECKKKYDMSFVCLATEKRLMYLEKIAKYSMKYNRSLFIAGHFWHNSNLINYLIGKIKFKYKYPFLYHYVKNEYLKPSDLANIYTNSKICLNINIAKHNSFNGRNFDIMIRKALVITDKEDLTGIDLLPDKEFIMADSPDDMIEKIDYYLVNESQRKEIAENGYNSVKEKYLFQYTLDKILR